MANIWENINDAQTLKKQLIDKEIEKLNWLDNKNTRFFSYKKIEFIDWNTGKDKVIYNAIYMWETLNIDIETPEQLINILKLAEKIISIYIKEWYKKWEKFYGKNWTIGTDKKDLAIDNRPFNILDTDFLSQEWLGKLLNENDNKLVNIYINEFADFLNRITEKIY
jgi:hypothetical protein